MDHEEEIQPTGKLEEHSSSIPGQEIMEEADNSNSSMAEVTPLTQHSVATESSHEGESGIMPDFPEGLWGRKWEFQDEKETFVFFENCADQWTTVEEDNPWANWDPEWTDYGTYRVASMEADAALEVTLDLDYVDQGFPKTHFLKVYPETHGSKADGIWAELPGYSTGRIGFMMLLNDQATVSYVKNEAIWPGEWWTPPELRYQLYYGGWEGYKYWKRQKEWGMMEDRGTEEEEFLTKVVARMITFFGRFSWDGFCWAAREEQKSLGEHYRPFWKDWENAAFGC